MEFEYTAWWSVVSLMVDSNGYEFKGGGLE